MKHALFVVSLCAISGASIVGCSASTEPVRNGGGNDAATMTDPGNDAGTMPATPAMLAPDVYLVNAATGLGDVRLCFLPDSNPAVPSDVLIPQTNYPGLAVGGAAFFRRNGDVRAKMVTPFAVTAEGLGEAEYGRTPYSCGELNTNPIIKRTPIAPIKFRDGGAAIYALVGCPAGVGDATRCGPTFSPSGNLHFVEVTITGSVPLSGVGALTSNLSPSIEAQVNGMTASGMLGPLGSPCVGATIGQGTFAVGSLLASAPSIARPTAFDTDGFSMCLQQQTIFARSFAAVQRATDPTSVPGDWFHDQADYVFAIVGDTTVQSGPEAVHALAIPFEATK